MDATGFGLLPVLVLLASSVLAVAACRSLQLPPMIGYLAVGLVLGPHALGAVPETEQARHLAEFGVVFLMFSIGLEFSLPKLRAMRRAVFGLGLSQVALTMAAATLALAFLGPGWQAGLALGGVVAMSSTAVVIKLLAERMELDSAHGRDIVGVLLFQDLAVVPLLILVPALGQPADALGRAIGLALVKAAVVLAVVLVAGPRLMRSLLGMVARRRSTELFVLNVLLVTLGLAFVTGAAGLSLALGAFLAGMLISETEYRYRVEQEIQPFRDVLLGLFFVTVGMMLDPRQVIDAPLAVALFFVLIVAGKCALVVALSRAFGTGAGTALRTALALAQGGEFGFVLLAQVTAGSLLPAEAAQPLLAAMILSMLATPFMIAASDRIVLRFAASEWMARSLELHRIAVQSLQDDGHVIILGYGRNGQRLARLLEAEGLKYVALDLDPDRVREAGLAGDRVVFADSVRRESLVAAGIMRAAAVVVTFADARAAVRVLSHIHGLRPGLPVIVRARDENDIGPLTAAGASEVVPEALESGLMLASHTLVWLGVPLTRVMRRIRAVRDEHYGLLRGLFHGAGDEPDTVEEAHPRLHAFTLTGKSHAAGREVATLGLGKIGVEVTAVRRPGRGKLSPAAAGALEDGDVVVLLGTPEALEAADQRLERGA